MANILERLTEGTVFQDKRKESEALVGKWEASGLLEGIKDEYQRGSMAMLLENQAKELLREANQMSTGDVQGFAAVAFPIVRRVFAGLIANDLVSVQPMSLPSGLVFFMDFRHGTQTGLDNDTVTTARPSDEGLFGDRLGEQVRQGVRVDGNAYAEKGFFALTSGYGTARASVTVAGSAVKLMVAPIEASTSGSGDNAKSFRFDPDLLAEESSTKRVLVYRVALSDVPSSDLIAEQDLTSLAIASGSASVYSSTASVGALSSTALSASLVRRLTRIVEGKGVETYMDTAGTKYLELVFLTAGTPTGSAVANASVVAAVPTVNSLVANFPIKDKLTGGLTDSANQTILGALAGTSPWALESSDAIPEIQLKVDSFSITARSRKLKAAWTPELGQDLNAYHNLDAEVELTSILSEQIGLEIDQEILNDLIKGATGGVKYWSRRPGKFVNRNTGADLGASLGAGDYVAPPDFTGNVSMWYETLLETVNDVSANIHRKTLRGGANFIVVSPEVANILEFTAGFRATVTHDSEKGTTGAVKVGALNSKFDVIVDPYFPRNVILVGRKGASFLESGFVYAPYVPLQTTPTIFDPTNFTPRKAVMTRYGKAMVRPDMYGLVVVQDLLG
jgi:hypothetical protein